MTLEKERQAVTVTTTQTLARWASSTHLNGAWIWLRAAEKPEASVTAFLAVHNIGKYLQSIEALSCASFRVNQHALITNHVSGLFPCTTSFNHYLFYKRKPSAVKEWWTSSRIQLNKRNSLWKVTFLQGNDCAFWKLWEPLRSMLLTFKRFA